MGKLSIDEKLKDALQRKIPNNFTKEELTKAGKYQNSYAKRLQKIEKFGLAKNSKNASRACREKNDEDCIVGSYEEVKKQCAGDAHHVIPDGVYRGGGRPGTTKADMANKIGRVKNAPTMGEGVAICLHPVGHTKTHAKLNKAIEDEGTDGTADIKKIREVSVKSLLKDKTTPPSAACKKKAAAKAKDQTEDLEFDKQQVRTTSDLPSKTAKTRMNLVKG